MVPKEVRRGASMRALKTKVSAFAKEIGSNSSSSVINSWNSGTVPNGLRGSDSAPNGGITTAQPTDPNQQRKSLPSSSLRKPGVAPTIIPAPGRSSPREFFLYISRRRLGRLRQGALSPPTRDRRTSRLPARPRWPENPPGCMYKFQ